MTPRLLLLALALFLPVLPGCRAALGPAELGDASLGRIQSAFDAVVSQRLADPEVRWVHGWSGNDAVRDEGGDGRVMGYCWQWQETVYAAMRPTVLAEGWEIRRININRGHFSEHHAVAVWDPDQIAAARVLVDRDPPVFVLDAWLDGRPDVYRLIDWLSIPVIVFEAAAFEEDQL